MPTNHLTGMSTTTAQRFLNMQREMREYNHSRQEHGELNTAVSVQHHYHLSNAVAYATQVEASFLYMFFQNLFR